MIAGMRHGMVPDKVADQYPDYIRATGLRGLKSAPGNRGVMILREAGKGRVHFMLISYRESYEAIAGFAGSDIEKSRYYPDDEKYLIEAEPNVAHYEVITGQEMMGG